MSLVLGLLVGSSGAEDSVPWAKQSVIKFGPNKEHDLRCLNAVEADGSTRKSGCYTVMAGTNLQCSEISDAMAEEILTKDAMCNATIAALASATAALADKDAEIMGLTTFSADRQPSRPNVVTTLAGSGSYGVTNGVGTAAQFKYAFGISLTPDGSTLFVTDFHSPSIRQIDVLSRVVTTFAGAGSQSCGGDGIGTAVSFKELSGITVSHDGTRLLLPETYGHRIRMIDIATRAVTTIAGSAACASGFADGVGTSARFLYPDRIVATHDDATLFVADGHQHRVRKVTVADGVVTTFAGSDSTVFADGVGTAAGFDHPSGLAISPDDTLLFVSDSSHHRVRQIVIATGVVTTLFGSGSSGSADGTFTGAAFNGPGGMTISPDGALLLVTTADRRIRQMVLASGAVTTIAGSGSGAWADGVGTTASFKGPSDIAISPDAKHLYVADGDGHRYRQISA
jgi:DNA-binding beta-propeller fold protein YncE